MADSDAALAAVPVFSVESLGLSDPKQLRDAACGGPEIIEIIQPFFSTCGVTADCGAFLLQQLKDEFAGTNDKERIERIVHTFRGGASTAGALRLGKFLEAFREEPSAEKVPEVERLLEESRKEFMEAVGLSWALGL